MNDSSGSTLVYGATGTLMALLVVPGGNVRALLAYLDDEAYRRRILIQINRGEARHALAGKVFPGHRGELRQPYREGHLVISFPTDLGDNGMVGGQIAALEQHGH